MSPTDLKFIADAMLGRLATWMRILGYDVEYFSRIPDEEILARAQSEKRIILTRDTLLLRRRAAREISFFVEGDSYKDQLRQVVNRFPPGLADTLSRCLRCNSELAAIEKESVRDRVPPYVYKTQEKFLTCPKCNRIYWGATHTEQMHKQLREMGLNP